MSRRPAIALAVLLFVVVAGPAAAGFADTEVSGLGAEPFRLAKGEWSYEAIPGVTYNFYRRADGDGGFGCIHSGEPGSTWGGDPDEPPPGVLYRYVVTAFDGREENSPGDGGDGSPKPITNHCPAPTRLGACCDGVGGCAEVSLADCHAASGTYHGDGSSCADLPTPCSCGPFPAPPSVSWRLVATLDSPVDLTAPVGGDSERVFVVEQRGRIRIVDHATVLPAPFLDISSRVACCGERGLLGLAFHPDYASNGRFYVDYTAAGGGTTTVSEFQVSADPDLADAGSERILLEIAQPATNHNGGGVRFGPDGYLYIGMGDGGGGCDGAGGSDHGQNTGDLLGAMLRIDVDTVAAPLAYGIPPDNPFAAGGGRAEIWSFGVRNPWRFNFDRLTGDLYIADVGQGQREEIDVQPAWSPGGENWGWVCMEGTLKNTCSRPPDVCPDPPPTPYAMPVYDYAHGGAPVVGCSVTGGYVYRGAALPDLGGHYFFADYCSGWVRSFRWACGAVADETVWSDRPGYPAGLGSISAFGEDSAGELYLLSLDGPVYKLEP